MREILFRGQHRKYGQKVNMAGKKLPSVWVYGGIFPGTGDYSIIYGGKSENFTAAEIDKWPVYSETVGQYTGLTDKNGKKIFEGDILALNKWKPYYVVKFEDGTFCMVGTAIPIRHANKFEVIGNIHDNPELLGGEHK